MNMVCNWPMLGSHGITNLLSFWCSNNLLIVLNHLHKTTALCKKSEMTEV